MNARTTAEYLAQDHYPPASNGFATEQEIADAKWRDAERWAQYQDRLRKEQSVAEIDADAARIRGICEAMACDLSDAAVAAADSHWAAL